VHLGTSNTKLTYSLQSLYSCGLAAFTESARYRVRTFRWQQNAGIWTGTKWWITKGEIQPVKWELEERKEKKTDKLRKAIARDEKLI
jgi:hypothetical protein